jgi:hypothetical protein
MTEMLRYKWTSFGPILDEDGPFVLFVDAEAGQHEAIAAAVQRVEALPWTSETWTAHAERAAIIAAIKRDQP